MDAAELMGGTPPLRIEPQGLLSTCFVVMRGGQAVAEIDLARLRDRASLAIDGVAYTARPEGLLSRTVLLEQGARVIARAQRPLFLIRRVEITAEDRQLSLVRKGLFRRGFVLKHGDLEIGQIDRASLFGRAATASFSDNLPAPLQVFAILLALLLWRRARRARHASTG